MSYTESARFSRSITQLSFDQRESLTNALTRHGGDAHINSVQRCGSTLYLTVLEGKNTTVLNFDFGAVHLAQACLNALTDCLRAKHAPVRVLMPASSPS